MCEICVKYVCVCDMCETMCKVWCLVPNLTKPLLHAVKHPPMAGSQACFTCSMANIAAVTQAAPCTSGAVSWQT